MNFIKHDNLEVNRKQDHIDINLNYDVMSKVNSGFDKIKFIHNALPEINYSDIDITSKFLNKILQAPVLISSMTGGTDHAKEINYRLAKAAQATGVAMALGSMRVFLKEPNTLASFNMRNIAPDILLMANIGAVQLNYGVSPKDCQLLIDSIKADALILHLNVLQELLQPEGDTNWDSILPKIKEVINYVSVPIIIKEVGYGISAKVAKELIKIGVYAIDVAGSGGTSWSAVESYRIKNDIKKRIAESFIDWGIATVDSIEMVRSVSKEIPLIASGGIKSGIDGAKALGIGADIFGLAQPFLKAADISQQAVLDEIELINEQLKICMCATGALTLKDLKNIEIIKV